MSYLRPTVYYSTSKSAERHIIWRISCAPTGSRTPVSALRGPRPRPLDDEGGARAFYHIPTVNKQSRSYISLLICSISAPWGRLAQLAPNLRFQPGEAGVPGYESMSAKRCRRVTRQYSSPISTPNTHSSCVNVTQSQQTSISK